MSTQTTVARPAPFVEQLGKDLATQVVAQTATPIVAPGSGGITQLTGESAGQFEARKKAAQQFDIRQQSLAGLAPQVAGLSQLEKDARTKAQAGIGSFQPFVTAAQGATGPQAFQQFMSPYQQQVIDTSLAEFDRQAQAQEQRIRDSAVASGAFGGSRQGVAEAEYGAASDRNRAQLQAGLLQQGFGQAQQAAQQNFMNQMGLASALPGLQRADVSTLGQLGALDRGLAQGQLDADREAARMSAFQPQEQVDRYANIVTGIMGGYPGQIQQTNIPNPTPLQNALAIGSTGAGIYGAITGKFNPTNLLRSST